MNVDSIDRSRSGSARAKCSAMNAGRSIELGSTVIVVISFSRAFAGLLKDHAVAVTVSGPHAHNGPVVHHVRGLNWCRVILGEATRVVHDDCCSSLSPLEV